MGQALTRVLVETPGCAVAGAIEAKGSPHVGRDVGEIAGLSTLGVAITDDPLPVFAHIDGVLDFTAPASTVAFAAFANAGDCGVTHATSISQLAARPMSCTVRGSSARSAAGAAT